MNAIVDNLIWFAEFTAAVFGIIAWLMLVGIALAKFVNWVSSI